MASCEVHKYPQTSWKVTGEWRSEGRLNIAILPVNGDSLERDDASGGYLGHCSTQQENGNG